MKRALPENLWTSPIIKNRLIVEATFDSNHGPAEKHQYWTIVPQADSKRGEIILKNFKPGVMDIEPHEMQQEFARRLQEGLQKHAHFDGFWLVGWTHPPASWEVIREDGDNCWYRLIMIWLDEDGDPHYTLESDMPFPTMVENGLEYYAKLAHEAHETWSAEYATKKMKKDMGLTDDQQTKAVLASIH